MIAFSCYNQDYKSSIPNLPKIKMVITSPPDAEEIGLDPDSTEYLKFMEDFCENIIKVTGLICIVITDRKKNGIKPKHSILTYNMIEHHGYRLLSHKIWVKSDKIDLFRLTYAHIMVFANGKVSQKHDKEYEIDVWKIPKEKYMDYVNGFPEEVVRRVINNFTDKGDWVYDPFMGSGTTGVVCKSEGRNCIGSEIDNGIHEMCMKRIDET